MADKKTMSRGARFVNTLILLVALLVGIGLVNLISTYVFGRADLTENQVNSLSPQSVEVLQSMVGQEAGGPLEIRLFISKTLPDSVKGDWGQDMLIRGVDQKLRDKIEEFRSQGQGRVEVVEVADDVEKKAEEAGVEPFVAEEGTVKEGRFEMTRYVVGATLHWHGEVEVLGKALDPNFFEFEITKRLIRLKDRVEHVRKIEHLVNAADAISEALKTCTDELTAFEVKPDEKQETSGIEGLLAPIENMEEEAAALAKNRETILEKCDKVRDAFATSGEPLAGQHHRFDAIVRGTGPKEQVGGLQGFVTVLDEFAKVLAADPPDVQRVMELKKLLLALKEDADAFTDMLKKAPGQRKIGFVCGHGEFCPFPSDKPVIDPKIAGMMGQQNPIHQRFLDVALQLQQQVNQILAGISNGLFTDKDFDVEKVDASQTIGDDISALVIWGPREKYSPRELYEIDQFLMRGGTILVLADNFDVSLSSFSEEAIKAMGPFNPNPNITNDFNALAAVDNNLDELLSPYGIELNRDLVVDPVNNARITLPHSVRKGRMVIRGTKDFDYPLLTFAREFDRSNIVVRSLPGLTMPFSSSMKFAAPEGSELTASELIKSGPEAAGILEPATLPISEGGEKLKLLPPELMEQAQSLASNGPHTLALMVTGKFPSAFKGKDEPPEVKKEEPEQEGMPPKKEEKKPERRNEGEGRLLVLGSALGIPPLTLESVFKDVNVQQITQGEVLVPQVRLENWKIKLNQLRAAYGETIPAMFNMLDWAVQRAALAEIRAKNYAFRPIEKTEEDTQRLISYATIGGLPLLFILFGVAWWQLRVMQRRSLARRFKSARGQTPKTEAR
ncbi:MAG: hypothetical protein FJ109_01880 [Deltaproteobacteria bacterium]|nr:hypothetical protein [Deltaproteobacteria bacterium]